MERKVYSLQNVVFPVDKVNVQYLFTLYVEWRLFLFQWSSSNA